MSAADGKDGRGSNMPKGDRCPIGPLGLHTYNYERTECIWCGPGHLAWKPGVWVPGEDGSSAWSVVEPVADPKTPEPPPPPVVKDP